MKSRTSRSRKSVAHRQQNSERNNEHAGLLAAELGADVPTLDLHGYRIEHALYELETFIYRLHPVGTEVIRIIHGRGTHKLRSAIHVWLQHHPDIVGSFCDSGNPYEQGAVTYARLTS